jgi:N-acetylmuramoyl-L-alanine amidase
MERMPSSPLFRVGDRAAAVAQIRGMLVDQHLLAPGPDDVFDTDVERAVQAFQQARGLSVDGIVGPETWRSLLDSSRKLGSRLLVWSVSHPLSGDDVRELQSRLMELGFDVGRADGTFTERTERALATFQREMGLTSDGQCGPQTLRELQLLAGSVRGGNPHELREAEALKRRGPTLAGRTVVIDPGQGGEEPGEVGPDGSCERDILWDIASRLEGRLQAAGASPVLTRGAHNNPSQEERASLANRTNAEVCLSMHCESGAGEGVASYYFGAAHPSAVGQRLADLCQREIVARTDLLDGRTHPKTWDFLRLTRMPAVRIFIGHLSHAGDGHKLSQAAFRDTIAEALLVAVQRLVLPADLDPPTGQMRIPVLR